MQKDSGGSNVRDVTVVDTEQGPIIVSVGFDKTIRLTQCSIE